MSTSAPAPLFLLPMTVRDYECDLQGIVNNSVYQNYLEHTRHEFLKDLGFDFAEMHRQGLDPVVTRAEIDYKYSLTSGDHFVVTCDVETKGKLRFIFVQKIYKTTELIGGNTENAHPDFERMAICPLSIEAKIFATVLSGGRPVPAVDFIAAVNAAYEKRPEVTKLK